MENLKRIFIKNFFEKWIEHYQSSIQFSTKNGFLRIKSFIEKSYKIHRQE
jgi:hypothetical protein